MPSMYEKRRADLGGAEAMYKKAGAVDPFHANSIYNYAVLLDSSLKQQEVSLRYVYTTPPLLQIIASSDFSHTSLRTT